MQQKRRELRTGLLRVGKPLRRNWIIPAKELSFIFHYFCYRIEKLKGKKPASATPGQHKDSTFYIHVQVKDEVPEPQTAHGVLDVDLGKTDIAAPKAT
jgi:hypothetical protein